MALILGDDTLAMKLYVVNTVHRFTWWSLRYIDANVDDATRKNSAILIWLVSPYVMDGFMFAINIPYRQTVSND